MKFHNCYTIMAGQDSCRFATAWPSSAGRWIRSWISTMAPTSTPRVGSSKNDHQIGILHQQFGNHHFLLLAARQFDDLHVITGGACLERAYPGHHQINANDPKPSLDGSLPKWGARP
jgi:hypothetical protein